MNRYYISVASNIEPERNIRLAVSRLRDFGRLISTSRCFVTEAIASPDDKPGTVYPRYINCVLLFESSYDAKNFKQSALRTVESELGRVRTKNKFAARTIDLDILLCNEDIIKDEYIEIPDPDILSRWFLIQGILDIDPNAKLPTTSKPLAEYLDCLLGPEKTRESDRVKVDKNLKDSLMPEKPG